METMDEIIAHLGAALAQVVKSDDEIIVSHIRSAYAIAKDLVVERDRLRAALETYWTSHTNSSNGIDPDYELEQFIASVKEITTQALNSALLVRRTV